MTPSIITDYKIKFGFSVKIASNYIKWYQNGKRHRDGGPVIEYIDGIKMINCIVKMALLLNVVMKKSIGIKMDNFIVNMIPAIELSNGI